MIFTAAGLLTYSRVERLPNDLHQWLALFNRFSKSLQQRDCPGFSPEFPFNHLSPDGNK
jgi:hypothetical protein